jgi:uracil-DNA glycosylase
MASKTATLLREIRACRICEDVLPLGPRPVLQIHRDARILIAGQAPGSAVHESGVPFQDPSGDRLREWLGVTSEEFYDPRRFAIVPMGFCYPGRGRSGDLPPRPECEDAWREAVLAALPSVRCTLVIGQYALAYHLPGKKGVTETVRDWRSHAPELFPLPHPSPRNNRWLAKNPWFARRLLPALKREVRGALDAPSRARRRSG